MNVTFRQNPRTAGRLIDGQAFVVTPHDNKLHTLNGTGSLIWELAETGCSMEDIVGAMTRRYRVDPEQARADAARFCEDLCARGILERA